MLSRKRLSLFVLLLAQASCSVLALEWGSKSFADVVKEGIPAEECAVVNADGKRKQSPPPVKKKLAPGVYKKLPKGVKQFRVRNVYDGDTLTLIDERRVRFLGVDTPELREKQPFALEAKAYTKDRCHKQDVWLEFSGSTQKDHYGRLLAFVWVPSPEGDGFLCINEGLVAQGLASVYSPDLQSRTSNWNTLVALQKQARETKLGMWGTFSDFTVYKTKNGAAYHLQSCQHLATARHLTPMKASDASDRGLHPCRSCLP